jgi:hypothetical protein
MARVVTEERDRCDVLVRRIGATERKRGLNPIIAVEWCVVASISTMVCLCVGVVLVLVCGVDCGSVVGGRSVVGRWW